MKFLVVPGLFLFLIILLMPGCSDPVTTTVLNTGSIQFQVDDVANNPLRGVKIVSNTQPDGQMKLSSLSDERGIVLFKDIKPGDYEFYVNPPDYYPHEIATTVIPGQAANIKIQLTSSIPSPTTPAPSPLAVTFAQLVAEPEKYNGQAITIEGFWFDGFEIAVLAERLEPANFEPGNVQPKGALIWIKGGLPETISNQLYLQPNNPTGYPAHYGKVELTGTLEYGNKYGHMNAYQYQLTVQSAKLLPYSP